MNRTMLLLAGFGLAGGLATAVQAQEMQDPTDYDQAQSHEEMGHDTADLTSIAAEDLEGKTVQTATGEDIGEIDAVMTNTETNERVAVVEAGGFLGIGEKTIAIPLSDLQKSTEEDAFRTSMTRESIESQAEFDESGYTREEGAVEEDDTIDY